MIFKVTSLWSNLKESDNNQAWLIRDSWDDWYQFDTRYVLVYIDAQGRQNNIGQVKIGEFNMADRTPKLPRSFKKLDEDFFSLGQDDSYYENLNYLGDTLRDEILSSLNDLAQNLELYERATKEQVTKVSLLRYVTPTSVQGQFNRIANGGARLSQYDFIYTAPRNRSSASSMKLTFHVEPESNPPSNIHVLIGRNGVGKTRLLNNMIYSILNPDALKYGTFSSTERYQKSNLFANLISVTFSAFDESEPLPERRDKSTGVQYSYVGLKRPKTDNKLKMVPKSPTMLKNEFAKSVEACRSGVKNTRWKRALEILEADPIFKEAEVANVADDESNEKEFKDRISILFKKLSSGHKIVLLTITRLVESAEERSLVLIDEPEAHLHPPLLSAFIRALSDLLIQRNGVAIIATHSPVILQEVPTNCVWKLRRTGAEAVAERLEIESFGENVGVLTREVFGLEVTYSGFHKLLIDMVNKQDSNYDSIMYQFNHKLGMEARAILRGLLATKDE